MEATLKKTLEDQELVIFSESEAGVAMLRDKYMDLEITDVKDQAQFDLVHDGRLDCKNRRVLLEKERVKKKATALAFGKLVDNTAKLIETGLRVIEAHLQAEEDKVKEEQDRIEAEEAAKLKAIIDERIGRLLAVDAVMSFQDVAAMSDEEFRDALAIAELIYEEEQGRKADAIAAQKAEEERLEKQKEEQDAETERIKLLGRHQKLISFLSELAYGGTALTVSELEFKLSTLNMTIIEPADYGVKLTEKAYRSRDEARNILLKTITERKQIDKEDADRKATQNKLDADRKALEDEKERIAQEAVEKETADRAARRAEIDEAALAEALAVEQMERDQRAKAKREKEAAMKPDSDKLVAYLAKIKIAISETECAPLESEEAKKRLTHALQDIINLLESLTTEARNL